MLNRALKGVLSRLGVVVALTLAGVTPVSAQILNGSFESNFSNWSTAGDASVQTAAYGVTPTQGTKDALISTDSTGISGTGSVAAGTLDTFLGLSAGTLTGARGSAIKQSFTATAGQVITFDWDFLTNQTDPTLNTPQNHYSFYTLNTVLTNLATVNTASFVLSNTPDFLSETGYQTQTVTIPATGSYTLGFGVMNININDAASGLLLDNVQLTTPTATPEPGTLTLLAGLGTASLVGLLRRRRK
jgi:hypothetical protein